MTEAEWVQNHTADEKASRDAAIRHRLRLKDIELDYRMKVLEIQQNAMYEDHKRALERMEQESLDPTTAPADESQRHHEALTRPGWDGHVPDGDELAESQVAMMDYETFAANRDLFIKNSNKGMWA